MCAESFCLPVFSLSCCLICAGLKEIKCAHCSLAITHLCSSGLSPFVGFAGGALAPLGFLLFISAGFFLAKAAWQLGEAMPSLGHLAQQEEGRGDATRLQELTEDLLVSGHLSSLLLVVLQGEGGALWGMTHEWVKNQYLQIFFCKNCTVLLSFCLQWRTCCPAKLSGYQTFLYWLSVQHTSPKPELTRCPAG